MTFLPEDVVDGLYSAVGLAGLKVASLTLEPIAAINVAIPETFRMLNIALVDVGAGTSDISVTRDGSIIAYGMIPCAGDEITELLVQHYLVDFKTAEHIKLSSTTEKEIEYQDIMMIKHTITAEEVWDLIQPLVFRLTEDIAAKIKELNGGETVSATFVVGGGGKVHGFVEHLASELELPLERVALRGEEVLQEIHFEQEEIKKDPLLVTPIGICISYYDQKNNFVFVRFNGERIKLYDNNKLTIVDAALRAGFPNDQLFPRRGKEINFYVNGKKRIVRGEPGESAVVRVNGRITSINATLEPNSDIVIEPSTVGEAAVCRLEELEEYGRVVITFEVNGRMITCPKFAEVNGSLEPPYYEIQENDWVEMRGFYTVAQIMEFMDVEIDLDGEILVNNKPADLDTQVYENFSVEWEVITYRTPLAEIENVYGRPLEESEMTADELAEELKAEETEIPEEPKAVAEPEVLEKAQAPTGKVMTKQAETPIERNIMEEGAGTSKERKVMGEQPEVPKEQKVMEEQPEKTEEMKVSQKQPENLEEESEKETESTKEVLLKEPEASREVRIRETETSREVVVREPEGTSEATEKEPDSSQTLQKQEEEELTQEELEEKYLQSQQTVESDIRPTIRKKPEAKIVKEKPAGVSLQVIVNNAAVTLTGKASYVFVDVFDAIAFDLNAGKGRAIVTKLNGEVPSYTAPLKYGDVVEIYWED